ncbi:MAG TPA: hypothetical protein VGD84_24980 [Pseudonocardiaceae bacterium]
MADQSFFVHLQSLANFASELQTQLAGMATPIGHLDSMSTTPMMLGDFGEASALTAANQAAVAEMTDLLGQVKQAISFAENITTTVATGYQEADQNVAGGMQVDTSAATTTPSNPDSVWAVASGAASASTNLNSGNSGGNSGGNNSGGG